VGSGASRPAAPKPVGAKPANGKPTDGKPADAKQATPVPVTAKANGTQLVPSDGVDGDDAARVIDLAANGIDAMPAAAGDEGADSVPTEGNGSPSKGRTGGGSARTVSSRRRKGR
jgi:hypothetical protein